MQNSSSCTMNNTMFQNKSCIGSGPPIMPNTQSQTYITTSTVLLSVLIPVIVIGNALVILAFGTTRRLRTTTNYFVVSLAFADVMVGALSLPIFTIVINKGSQWPKDNPEVSNLWRAIDMITSIASIVNLMYISVDRYVCIQYPLRYHTMLTKNKVIVMIVLSWLYGVLNYSLIQSTYREGRPRLDVNLVMTILAFILPLLVILVMYGKIGKIAFNHRVRIIAIDEQQQSQNGQQQNPSQSHKNKRTLSLLAELKATRTLAVVVGAFVLCFIGYFVILLHTTICHNWKSLKCTTAPREVVIAIQWIKYFNSSLNPVIYTVMNSDMRKAMQRLIKGRLSPAESTFELR